VFAVVSRPTSDRRSLTLRGWVAADGGTGARGLGRSLARVDVYGELELLAERDAFGTKAEALLANQVMEDERTRSRNQGDDDPFNRFDEFPNLRQQPTRQQPGSQEFQGA